MSKSNVISLESPESVVLSLDPLSEVLRAGAKQLIQSAVEGELESMLDYYENLRVLNGRRAVVCNGYLPAREIQTGIGGVEVRVPKVRDRSGSGIKFNSRILPPYLRKSKSIEELLPFLYLKGVSTGDFGDALTSLLGKDAPGLSASVISRLKRQWEQEHQEWEKRSLAEKNYVYLWVDGVYFNIRNDNAKQCILVILGAKADGTKELVSVSDGYRESEASWLEVLRDCKRRGLSEQPKVAVGDGALGFWKALKKEFPATKQQRCWVHKTANVLNKLPKSMQPKTKKRIHDIYLAETLEEATKEFDALVQDLLPKYPKASKCLSKDREQLLTFYSFPAEHWAHLRTTNPIESTFATVRLRTNKTRGCVSRNTILAMVFKLTLSAEKQWRKLRGFSKLAKVVEGVVFENGIEVTQQESQCAA